MQRLSAHMLAADAHMLAADTHMLAADTHTHTCLLQAHQSIGHTFQKRILLLSGDQHQRANLDIQTHIYHS